jgi:hypothetical protein
MGKLLPLILMMVTVSCSPPTVGTSPLAYSSGWDRLLVKHPWLQVLRRVCVKNGSLLPDEQCYRFEAPRRWSGIIIHNDNFQNYFYPGRSGYSRERSRSSTYGVTNAPVRRYCQSAVCRPLGPQTPSEEPDAKAYYIEFVGRRTAHEGPYGHMGVFGHLIVVDRILAERQIPTPVLRDQ